MGQKSQLLFWCDAAERHVGSGCVTGTKVAKLLLPRHPTASGLQELLSAAKEDALPEVRLEAQR